MYVSTSFIFCRPWHSYKEKGKLNVSKLTAYTMSFLIQNRDGQSRVIRGKTVLQTLENFFSSSDDEICEEHTPIWFINTHGEKKLVTQREKEVSTHEERRVGLHCDIACEDDKHFCCNFDMQSQSQTF